VSGYTCASCGAHIHDNNAATATVHDGGYAHDIAAEYARLAGDER
jgi:hypothetical protein